MDTLRIFFGLGIEHLTDLNGYDHLLFLAAMVAGYRLRDWPVVAWLVTAFTVGHSVSLALATLGWIVVSSAWVEFLIPVTIVLTCVLNLVQQGSQTVRSQRLAFGLVLLFGLVHGVGFSGFLRGLLGREASIALPLLGFNLGLEAGQLAVVGCLLGLGWLLLDVLGTSRRLWVMGLSVAVGALAIALAVERWPG
jgi:HupE / UreJ protein